MTNPEDRELAAGGLKLPGIVVRMDHVAIAVSDLAGAVHLYQDVLGGTFIAGGDDESLGIRTAQFRFPPGVKVEFLTPLNEDSYLQRYLSKHGSGFHHLTCFVEDVEVAAKSLEDAGYEVVDTDLTKPGWRETFVRPRSGFGALLQLAESDHEWSVPALPGATADDVLAGRVEWKSARPQFKTTPDA